MYKPHTVLEVTILNKAVFSDLDGTLSKGFVTVDFARFLAEEGICNKQGFALHEKLMQDYARGEIKYIDLVPKWSNSVALCLKGLEVQKVEAIAVEFFKEWKQENLYASTKPLVEMLKEHSYLFLLVSAGLELLVGLVSKEIGADGFVGMRIGTSAGKFNGVLVEEFGVDRAKTMGFGDSIQDRAIFESVKKPVALNPSRELREKAEKEGWYIAGQENVLQVMQDCFDKRKNP